MRFVPNKGHSTPAGLTNWSKGAGGDKYIKGIGLSTPTHDKQDALIGFFTDQKGRRYFMLQNLYRAPGLSAAAATSTITVNFGGGNSRFRALCIGWIALQARVQQFIW